MPNRMLSVYFALITAATLNVPEITLGYGHGGGGSSGHSGGGHSGGVATSAHSGGSAFHSQNSGGSSSAGHSLGGFSGGSSSSSQVGGGYSSGRSAMVGHSPSGHFVGVSNFTPGAVTAGSLGTIQSTGFSSGASHHSGASAQSVGTATRSTAPRNSLTAGYGGSPLGSSLGRNPNVGLGNSVTHYGNGMRVVTIGGKTTNPSLAASGRSFVANHATPNSSRSTNGLHSAAFVSTHNGHATHNRGGNGVASSNRVISYGGSGNGNFGGGRHSGWAGGNNAFFYGYSLPFYGYGYGWGGLLGTGLYGLGSYGYMGPGYGAWGYGGYGGYGGWEFPAQGYDSWGYGAYGSGYFPYDPYGYGWGSDVYGPTLSSVGYTSDPYAGVYAPASTPASAVTVPVSNQGVPPVILGGSQSATQPATQPDGAESYAEKGENAFKTGDYEGAAYAWRHAAIDDPQNGLVVMLLGQALFATGKFEEAAGATQAAMQLLPKDKWGVVVSNAQDLYGNYQDYTTHLRALENAVREKPDNPAQRFLIGFHYAYLGFPRDAVAQLDKTLKVAPQDQGAKLLRDELRAKLSGAATDAAPLPTPETP